MAELLILKEKERHPHITNYQFKDWRPVKSRMSLEKPVDLWSHTKDEEFQDELVSKRKKVFRLECGWESKDKVYSKFGFLDEDVDIVSWTRSIPESHFQRCFYEYIIGERPQGLY